MVLDLLINRKNYNCFLIYINLIIPFISEQELNLQLVLHDKTDYRKIIDIQRMQTVELLVDGKKIFSGFIWQMASEPNKMPQGKSQFRMVIRCRSVQMLLDVRTTYYEVQNSTTKISDAINSLLVFLNDEGISAGSIVANQLLPKDYKFRDGTFSDFLNNLSDLGGYKWWVDENKKLNFTKDIPKRTIAKPSSIEKRKYEFIKSEQTMTDYFNKVIIVGDGVGGEATDNAEINLIKSLNGGSGVFSKIIRAENITSTADANAYALEMLNKYSYTHQIFKLKIRHPSELLKIGDVFDFAWQTFNYTVQVFEIEFEYVEIGHGIFVIYSLYNLPSSPKKINYNTWYDGFNTLEEKNKPKEKTKEKIIKDNNVPLNFIASVNTIVELKINAILVIMDKANAFFRIKLNSSTVYERNIEIQGNNKIPFSYSENFEIKKGNNIFSVEVQNVYSADYDLSVKGFDIKK